jgi:hypothetical protein
MQVTITEQERSRLKSIAQRKISMSDQQKPPEPLGLTGDELLGHAMVLFSLGIPYRGSGALASPDPTNQLPTSLLGQATRPPGGSTAPLQLF